MWRVLLPTLFPGSIRLADTLHSISVSFSAEVAVPFSVDVKEVALVPEPKPVPALALRALFGPHREEEFDLCTKVHSLLPPTLQMVTPFLSPSTVQLKVKVSPGHAGGAAVNCPVTSPRGQYRYIKLMCHLV